MLEGEVFSRFVEIGRVAFIAVGKNKGKLCVIVDVIDQTRGLIDGPCSDVRRQAIRFRYLHLTEYVLTIPHSARAKTIKTAWAKSEIDKKWQESSWCKKLQAKKRRAAMTDFDRFKLMIAKKQRNAIITKELTKLKKTATKAK